MDEYGVLVKWRVSHGYFRDKRCRGIELMPTPGTLQWMRRRAVVFKKIEVNEWVLLGNTKTQWDEEEEITVAVEIKEKQLWYYTEKPDAVQEIRVVLKEMQPGQEVDLNYEVKRMRWEYLLIAREEREEQEQRRLELVETAGRLNFEDVETIGFMGKTVFRIVSRELVDLCETYDYQLRLVDRKVLGKRTLSKNIEFPEPGRFLTDSGDCIRQVIYY